MKMWQALLGVIALFAAMALLFAAMAGIFNSLMSEGPWWQGIAGGLILVAFCTFWAYMRANYWH